MVRHQHRSPVPGVFDLVTQPLDSGRLQCGGTTSELIVQGSIETDELPVIVTKAKVTRRLFDLIKQVIERLAACIEIVVPWKYERRDIARFRFQYVLPGAIKELVYFLCGSGVVDIAEVNDDLRIIPLDLPEYFNRFRLTRRPVGNEAQSRICGKFAFDNEVGKISPLAIGHLPSPQQKIGVLFDRFAE